MSCRARRPGRPRPARSTWTPEHRRDQRQLRGRRPLRRDAGGREPGQRLAGRSRDRRDGRELGAGVVHAIYGSACRALGPGQQYWSQNSGGISDSQETGDHFGASLAIGDFGGSAESDSRSAPRMRTSGAVTDAGVVHVVPGSASGLTATGSQYWNQNVRRDHRHRRGRRPLRCDAGGREPRQRCAGRSRDRRDGRELGAGVVHAIYGSASGLAATGQQNWSQNSEGIADSQEPGDHFGASLAIGELRRQRARAISRSALRMRTRRAVGRRRGACRSGFGVRAHGDRFAVLEPELRRDHRHRRGRRPLRRRGGPLIEAFKPRELNGRPSTVAQPASGGSRSMRTLSRSVPIRRTTSALSRSPIRRRRARGSSSSRTRAVPLRQPSRSLIRTRGFERMLRT